MIALLLAICLALVPCSASAQEVVSSGSASASGSAPASAATGAAGGEKAAPTGTGAAIGAEKPPGPAQNAEQLLTGSLASDIATSSYYALVDWCDQLGLDNSGSRVDLQKRLARHYDVTLPAEMTPAKRTVTVKSARQTEYYTAKDVDERYVILRGDVEIEVKDSKDGNTQSIKAASVTYNQTRRTISAEGGVTYSLTRGGQTDTFTGQSLAFNLDTSEAVFYDGKTTRKVKKSDSELDYTFSGRTMTRMSNDTVTLEDGTLTSSSLPEDPLYRVHAQTIWLLTPGEWALQNAVLQIGRVPILYFPALFWPGDDFVFNPNLGYKSREGSFLQTTTYLIGRKPKEDNALSFLQLNDAGDSGYRLETHGLFLQKITDSAAAKDNGQYLKLMLDGYSRLGLFAGLAGDFSPIATFKGGIGITRSIFYDSSTGYYTPYLPTASTGYTVGEDFWNSSSLLGLSVPFRYGLEGTVKSSGTSYDVSGTFQFYSDPSFTSDFYDRSEANFLSSALASQTSGTTTTTTVAEQTNLSWDVSSHFDFAKLVNVPFIQTLSVSSLTGKATWLSNTPSSLTDPEASDPGATFFYPSSITLPSISMTIGGDILSLGTAPTAATDTAAGAQKPGSAGQAATAPTSATAASALAAAGTQATNAAAAATAVPSTATTGGAASSTSGPVLAAATPTAASTKPAPDPGKGFRAPVPTVAPSTAATTTAKLAFREPALLAPTSAAAAAATGSTLKVSYQVQPRATLEHTFDTTNWTTKDAVDYSIKYQTLETGGSGSLTAATTLLGNAASLSAGLSTSGLMRTRFNPSTSERNSTEWNSLLLQDYEADTFSVNSTLAGIVRPLANIDLLSKSQLQYNLGLRLYELTFTGDTTTPVFTSTGPEWTSDAVSQHSLASSLVLSTPLTTDTLAFTAQFPPLVPTYTVRLDAAAGVVKGSVQTGYTQPTTGIVYQPLVMDAGLDFGSGYGANEELQYDISEGYLNKSTSTLNVGDLTSYFIATSSSASALTPSSFKISYEHTATPMWFWNDRIKLSLGVKSHWYMNLQSYVDNLFDFSLDLNLSIYKFLDLTFSSTSTNNKTYRYIPDWASSIGDVWVNPLTDLLNSFAFASDATRKTSSFKIKTISVKAVHHLPDWDLSLKYDGSVELRTDSATSTLVYQWTPEFTITAQWNAISQVKSTITGDYTGVSLR